MRKWLTSFALCLVILAPYFALAQLSVDSIGLQEVGQDAYGTDEVQTNIGYFIARQLIQPLLGLSGAIFLIMIIYAGILWMTDQGGLEGVTKAKKMLVHSTIGLILIVSAYSITQFVLDQLTIRYGG
jgi:hypothetical protein